MRGCFILTLIVGLAACNSSNYLAPVEELTWRADKYSAKLHQVRRGETLYAIAFRYDKDYRRLAVYNHISYPYALRIGQMIRLYPFSPVSKPQHRSAYRFQKPIAKTHTVQPLSHLQGKKFWIWPAKGKVIAYFSPDQGKKGIDIAGVKGQSIYAAAAGLVAYAGNGLNGYGNLIIIKHSDHFLTAYGNNLHNKVKEGQKVKAGEVIADMGINHQRTWSVHFEIRKAGQPVNPLHYLSQ